MLDDGNVTVSVRRIDVNHRPLPNWMMKIFSGADFQRSFNESFNEQANRDPKSRVLFHRLHSVRISDGRIVLTSEGSAPAPVATPPVPVATPAEAP